MSASRSVCPRKRTSCYIAAQGSGAYADGGDRSNNFGSFAMSADAPRLIAGEARLVTDRREGSLSKYRKVSAWPVTFFR